MKTRHLQLFALVAMTTLICGCGRMAQDIKHFQSDLIGLNRKITLYSCNGQPIREWEGRYKVEITGSVARFIHKGKVVTLCGSWLIEEI